MSEYLLQKSFLLLLAGIVHVSLSVPLVVLFEFSNLTSILCSQTYEIRVSQQRVNQAIVSIVFTNLTAHNIKNLEFNVMDTLNTKLSRGVGILVDFPLYLIADLAFLLGRKEYI